MMGKKQMLVQIAAHQPLLERIPVQKALPCGDVGFLAWVGDEAHVQTGATIANHGYRGGPFVVDSTNRAAALPIVQAWQSAHATTAVHAMLLDPAYQLK